MKTFASDAELLTLLQLTYTAHAKIYVFYEGMRAEAEKIQALIDSAHAAG